MGDLDNIITNSMSYWEFRKLVRAMQMKIKTTEDLAVIIYDLLDNLGHFDPELTTQFFEATTYADIVDYAPGGHLETFDAFWATYIEYVNDNCHDLDSLYMKLLFEFGRKGFWEAYKLAIQTKEKQLNNVIRAIRSQIGAQGQEIKHPGKSIAFIKDLLENV